MAQVSEEISHEQDATLTNRQALDDQAPRLAARDGRPDPLDRLDRTLAHLGRLCPELPLLGIQWMAVKHPLLPLHESWLQQTRSRLRHERSQTFTERIRWLFILCTQGAKCFIYAISLSVLLAWLRWHLRHSLAILVRQRFDLVAKSWGVDSTRPPEAGDFYFGDLQRRLANRQHSMLLLCGDVGGPIFGPRRWRAFADTHTRTEALPQLPELSLVSARAPLQMACQQVRTHLRLRRMARRIRHPFLRGLMESACRDCLSIHTTCTGLQFWVGQAVTRLWQPRALLTLYEGNSWERCLWWGAKTAEPSCLSVGYQHTNLMPHNRTLLRPSLHERGYARPDIVLCLGPRTRTLLQPSHPRSTLMSFGTFRQVPEPNSDEARLQDPAQCTVLVVPETGIIQEARLLFHFAMRAATLLSDHQFIFRCHPVMPFEQVRPHLDEDPERLPNVEISTHAAISEDFARASVVLYRGSSSVLYAVLYGLKPIYLRDERYEHSDSLFELIDWRESVSSVRELERALKRYATVSYERAFVQWRRAVEYVRQYVVPVTDVSVDRLLEAVGVTGGPTDR